MIGSAEGGRVVLAILVLLAVLVAYGSACTPKQQLAGQQEDGSLGPRAVDLENRPTISETRVHDADPDARLVAVPEGVRVRDRSEDVFVVEIAATNASRERGLMGRERLGKWRGMLFVYRTPGSRSYWMKDCLIGLDIAFLDAEGRILKTATLPPGVGLSGADVPSAACDGPVSFVLEVAARRLAELGVGTGDRVDVSAAVSGVEPE